MTPVLHAASGYSYRAYRRRTKSDWAGISLIEAYKPNLDWDQRRTAQRLLHQALKQAQLAVARQVDSTLNGSFSPKVKPQIAPAYTACPANVAIPACIGLTAFLEYQQWIKEKILLSFLDDYLKNPAEHDHVSADPQAYAHLARTAAENVQTRLLLEALSRLPPAATVETARLYLASQQALRFESLPEILRAVVLFGDVLPGWNRRVLHPVTREVLKEACEASAPFLARLPHTPSHRLVDEGIEWVKRLGRGLAPYLPSPQPESDAADGRDGAFKPDPDPSEPLCSPLGCSRAPTLFEKPDAVEQLVVSLSLHLALNAAKKSGAGKDRADPLPKTVSDLFTDFARTLQEAAGQKQQHQDMRSDLVARALGIAAFKEGPIQGNPTDGHNVKVPLGEGLEASGEIFDRALELSDDFTGLEKLKQEARPVVEGLRRALYPSFTQVPETERLKTTGSLDPARLPLADAASAIFRRYNLREQGDRRGRPVLLLACDGSGSLDSAQMHMLKILSCSWLLATAGKAVQVLAGIYHSGTVRKNLGGPLVQWLYHPLKTPATGRRDAARALLSLPDSGTGAQSDALSLAFMVGEAEVLARGRRIYLILMTDCAWNVSFDIGKSGKEEVDAYLLQAHERFGDRLHATLVALGVSGETGFENVVDKVIGVSREELAAPSAVAGKIGLYVAACMRERRRQLARGG